jgi:polyhydroxybutyrate depolymerase
MHDGINRDYTLYVPEDLVDNAPLVFGLHGYSGNASGFMNYCGLNELADDNKFVVCYPQGTKDRNNINHWNARLGISDTDDIGFLSELAGYLQNEYNLDSMRTYSCGHSNGGFMCYTLACEAPDVFKAVASMAGSMSGYTWDNRSDALPISILQIHGVDDQTVPIAGINALGWGGAPHMDSVVDYWAKKNECTKTDSAFFPNNTHAYFHTDGIDHNEVWYYKIDNWGHSWPGKKDSKHTGIIAGEVIWAFFKELSSNLGGVDNVDLQDIRISPNPASSIFYIESSLPHGTKYQLLASSGKVILMGAIQDDVTELDISALPDGLYILQVGEKKYRVIKAL